LNFSNIFYLFLILSVIKKKRNCDIKNLSRGCTVYFPVFVDGANLSMGDMHFSQGDGEVSFCGAIEMSGFIDLKCSVIKGGMKILPGMYYYY
jgi:formamidase